MQDLSDSGRPENVRPTRLDSRSAALIVPAPDEIDMRNSADLGQALTSAVGECVNRRLDQLIVDLSGVVFMSSTGLQELLRTSDRCSQAGIELALACPSPPVRRLLELAGIEGIAKVVDEIPN